MARHLRVELHGEHVGRLTQTDAGRLTFAYDAAWVAGERAPLSLSLPVRDDPFEHRETEPFFGGLLPEEGARLRVARFLGVTANNDFALLDEIGGECAGAVALLRDDAEAAPPSDGGHRVLTEDELVALLDDLPTRPLLAGGDRRLSLAGAQDKVAVSVTGGEVALPTGDAPTSHIVKVPIAGLASTVANEYVSMRTAARVGLSCANVEWRRAGARTFLLVERYDREMAGGAVRRVHQEDFCQALGVPTRMKYEAEGGPKLADLFALLTEVGRRPALDRLTLLRATIFNVLIGNADAHAKNFSVLHGADARNGVTLSPLYDVLSTLCYDGLSRKYAMKIGSKARFDDIRGRHWDALAKACGLAPPQVRKAALEACERIPVALADVLRETREAHDTADDDALLAKIEAETIERCEITSVRLRND